jgi:UDP-N-acetylglucosamine--N-acetylmuramyl-(pentapeptide) pyrophosphoryl-undecaprenol N-acetylglucosamine transferase
MAAGGTGGHVFPALAIARAAVLKDRNTKILFVGTPRGFEAQSVPAAGFSLELISIGGLKRKGWIDRIRNVVMLPKAFYSSWKILRTFSPSVAFGIGGYASGPILLLAAMRGLKTAILEPNAVPGFSNRVLGRVAHRIFLAFDEAKGRLPLRKCVVVGNPIRKEILNVSPPNFSSDRRTVLVFGGSQGAHRLNEAMIGALPLLEPLKGKIRFIHQTGATEFEKVKKAYAQSGFEAEVSPFIEGMADAYRRSDLVVARSGSSVMEIAACGRPSILVPFPFSADDHQRINGRTFERAGASIFIEDHDCTGEAMGRTLLKLVPDDVRLREMSAKALRLRRDDAAERIVSELLQWSADVERRAA